MQKFGILILSTFLVACSVYRQDGLTAVRNRENSQAEDSPVPMPGPVVVTTPTPVPMPGPVVVTTPTPVPMPGPVVVNQSPVPISIPPSETIYLNNLSSNFNGVNILGGIRIPFNFGVIRAFDADPSICVGKTLPVITRVAFIEIDFAVWRKENNATGHFAIRPNTAIIYKFTAPTEPYIGSMSYVTSMNAARAVPFVSISQSPCDFNMSKVLDLNLIGVPLANLSSCYRTGGGEGMGIMMTNQASVTNITYCKLTPGQTYYLNLRFQEPTLGAPTDSCTSESCGGAFTFQ